MGGSSWADDAADACEGTPAPAVTTHPATTATARRTRAFVALYMQTSIRGGRGASSRKLDRPDDPREHLRVGTEFVLGRNTDDIEQRAVTQERREELDSFGAASHLVLIREQRTKPRSAADSAAIVAPIAGHA